MLTATDAPDNAVETAIGGAVRTQALSTNAAAAGTTAAAIEKGTVLTTDRLDGQQDDSLFIKLASLAFSLLFFMAAILFGQQIAASVVEEKQSRLVEIIATAIPLRADERWSATELESVAGALASRTEDLQSTTAPMTMLLGVVYVVGFTVTGTALKVASFIPIVSVVAMPGRILSGDAAWWEPVVALLVMAGFAAVTVLVGEKIYRRSLMQTRGKMSWREGLKSADA